MCTVQCARSCPVHSVPGDGLTPTHPPSIVVGWYSAPGFPIYVLSEDHRQWQYSIYGVEGGKKLIPATHPVGQFPAILSLYLPVSLSTNRREKYFLLFDTVCQFPEGCRIILVSSFHSNSYVNRLIQRSNVT